MLFNNSELWIWGSDPVQAKAEPKTHLAIAIRQKHADLTITRVRTHVKSVIGTGLEIELSTFEIDK